MYDLVMIVGKVLNQMRLLPRRRVSRIVGELCVQGRTIWWSLTLFFVQLPLPFFIEVNTWNWLDFGRPIYWIEKTVGAISTCGVRITIRHDFTLCYSLVNQILSLLKIYLFRVKDNIHDGVQKIDISQIIRLSLDSKFIFNQDQAVLLKPLRKLIELIVSVLLVDDDSFCIQPRNCLPCVINHVIILVLYFLIDKE